MAFHASTIIIIESGGSILGDGSSDQIGIGSGGAEYNGSLGQITGPSHVKNGTTPTSGSGFGNTGYDPSLLPVLLKFFIVSNHHKAFQLSWATLTEENFDYFSIERSADAIHYQSIGTQKGNGYSTTLKEYEFTDAFPLSGASYYRLKAVDFDGYTEYFGPVSAWMQPVTDPEILLVENPVKNQRLQVYQRMESNSGSSPFTIMNISGKPVKQGLLPAGKSELDLSHCAPGIYFIRLEIPGNPLVKKFVVGS